MQTVDTGKRFLAILVGATTLYLATAAAVAQPDDHRTASGPSALSPLSKTIFYSDVKPRGSTTTLFNHGYLIQYIHNTTVAGESNVFLFNSSGNLEHEVAIWPEDTTKLFLSSVDVGTSGRLAFAGRATKPDNSHFFFIAVSDLDGQRPTYFSTGSYIPTQIAQADDGSIWSIGSEYFENASAVEEKIWKNYDMLNHYTVGGKLISHFLRRWGNEVSYVTSKVDSKGEETYTANNSLGDPVTNDQLDAIWGYSDAWKSSRRAYLRSAGAITVLYDGMRRLLCVLGISGSESNPSCKEIAGTSGDLAITGFGVNKDGILYASMASSNRAATGPRGLYRLDPLASGLELHWTRVDDRGNAANRLFGMDGDQLVYSMGKQSRGQSVIKVIESPVF